MTSQQPSQPEIDQTLTPDSTLYIYYCEGTLPRQHRVTFDGFLGNWEEDGFSFLFFLRPAAAEVDAILRRYPELVLLDQFEMTYEEWQGGNLEPLRIGYFQFSPPWVRSNADNGFIHLTLDSGVVFGNGTHPTTQSCIEAIQIACRGGKVRTMMDLGTGTGVLALAAAKLGCNSILAVDFNHLACRTALRNTQLNGLDRNILVVNGKAEELLIQPADLLVANIHYAIMKELVESEYFLRQKWFVLSGLLNSESEIILSRLKEKPVHILKKWHSNGVWNTILGITQTG